MGELSNFLVESILLEAAPIDKQIVVYSGRFQPFHKGHYATYENLVRKFGKDSVYIGTSNVTDSKKSPFNFNEKKAIMMKMFGIPSSKIVNVKNPYAPEEILKKYDSDTTGLIVVVGEKDQNRLGGKYFTPYKGKVEQGYLDKGYVYASPATANPISGTDVRYWLSAGSEEERKKNFTKAYPKFDEQIFKMITLKLKKLKECINEEITLNVKVGDTLLMGKFKNKKVVVKNIGTDEWGMPTINGKKAVTFRIPKKEELKEAASNAGFSGTAEPDTSFTADGQKRILNKAKPENWYKQGGYLQVEEPKADTMRGRGKSKDTETQFRKAYYKLKNVEKSTLNPADDPFKVEDWQDAYRENPNEKPKRFWELPDNQKGTIISKEDIKEIVEDFDSILDEMAKHDLDAVEKYADSQLSPEDIELGKETDHFFQRLNDPRNGKPISPPELTGFFKRLARNKKKFIEFVKQYKQFVVNDTQTNINIAFMKAANKLIAKTIMRKADFKSTSPIFKTEAIDEMGLGGGAGVGLSLPGGYINGAPNPKDVKKLKSKLDKDDSDEYTKVKEATTVKNHIPVDSGGADDDFNNHHKGGMYTPDWGYEAELDTIDFDDDRENEPGHQADTKDTQNKGYEPVKEIAVQVDNIPGGLANGKTLIDLAKKWDSKGYYEPKQFAAKYIKPELMKGIKVEMEHTNDVRIATEIAMDHLWEDLKYYDKLASIEGGSISETTGNGAFYNDGNATTGTMWNAGWDDYDNEGYYLDNLEGWDFFDETPSEREKKKSVDQNLPIDNHNDTTDKYNRILKHDLKSPQDFIKESSEKDLEKQLVVLYNKAFKMMPMSPAQMKVRAEIDKLKKQINSLKKESLNEVKWEDGTYKKCMLGKLPLSLNIVKKLVEPIRTTSLHATDIENLPKVAALQGTKKSISTFTQTTKWGKLVQGKGMHTQGGIMVALSGVVLAQSIMDLWTEPDKQGRRWVNPGTVISGLGREQDVVFNFAPELKPYKEAWMKNMFSKPATNQEKAEFIKKYYDAADRYMLSKKKEFQDKYLNSNALYYDSDWNEVVLSQIKIESILVVPSLLKVKTQVGSWTFDREDKDETDKIIKQLKQKYKNVVVANNESDISNFIKKNGGYIKESVNEATASEVIKDLDKVRNNLIKKVDVLIAKKKKLYSNVDIESPMSADEKQLDKDIQSIFSQIQQLIQQKRKIKTESVNESLLIEGGAYGHMNHPFDIEMNLTFGDLKQIVVKALNGDLELAREKTDGQALAVSWVNGRLVAARNKSHLKNKGEGAMTIGQVASKFAGRGGLTDAYNFAMQDLSKAIGSLSEPQRKKIFKDGACFMNLEVIYPTSVNVIPYNQPLLVFHGTFEYDKDGVIIGENQQAASILGGMIKQVNAHVQSKYTIQGPPMNKLPKSEDLSKLQGKYLGMISKLQSEFKLADSDGVADYHQAWWTNFVEKNAKKLDSQQKIGLVKRWAFGDKSFRIAEITDEKLRAWADSTDKQDQQKISKQNLMRFEEIFLGVGADVLSFMESVLTANPDSAKRQMVARLESTIQQVKASGDPKKIAKLKLELERLKALGGFDKIVPNEGIVFVYGGNTYKLTGAFAPLNQILGIFFDK